LYLAACALSVTEYFNSIGFAEAAKAGDTGKLNAAHIEMKKILPITHVIVFFMVFPPFMRIGLSKKRVKC
jgi:hypothetical protein